MVMGLFPLFQNSAFAQINPTQTFPSNGSAVTGGSVEAAALKKASENAPKLGPCFNRLGIPTDFTNCAALFANTVILPIASWFLWVAGWFFNFTISYSLNMGNFLKDVPIVDMGWKIARDLANICFIFILLYIAINTILQTKSADTKRLLIRVIVIAILLNFSLFFAKVVIDSSNILALQFYQKMGGAETAPPASLFKDVTEASGKEGLSQTLLKGLGLESVYNDGDSASNGQAPKTGSVLVVSLGGALLIMVTAFVLIAGAIMFVIRTIVLVFLMILAPLAFLSMVLPQTEQYWKKWIGMLLNQSFFAPFYLMLIYIVTAVVSGKFGGNVAEGIKSEVNLGTFLAGNGSSVGTLFVFVVLVGFMLASLIVAKSLGAYGGDFAKNVAGRATFGLSGWLGRQTVGRAFNNMAKSDTAESMRNATGDGKFLSSLKRGSLVGAARSLNSYAGAGLQRGFTKNVIDRGAEGTFDVRGVAGFGEATGLGKAGGEGGAKKIAEEEKKRKAEYEKTMVLDGKKRTLEAALALPATDPEKEQKVQKALYALSDSEFGELGSEKLTNAAIIQNAKPSQIATITDDKFDKLRVDQKNTINDIRVTPLKDANKDVVVNNGVIEVKEAKNASDRFKSLSSEAKTKLQTHKDHAGAWAPALAALAGNDAAAAKGAMDSLATTNSAAHASLLSNLKRSHIKNELTKLGSDEKAKALDKFLQDPVVNEEIIRNVDGDSIKAYENRKDLPAAEKEKLKTARHEMLVKDLKNASKDDAKELMKGLGVSELNKLISMKDETTGAPLFYDPTPPGGIGPVLTPAAAAAAKTFVGLLTDSQLRTLQDEGLDQDKRKAIGAQIAADPSARGHAYVTKKQGIEGGWI